MLQGVLAGDFFAGGCAGAGALFPGLVLVNQTLKFLAFAVGHFFSVVGEVNVIT